VTLDGRDIYLGKHNSPESHAEYHRLLGEWKLHGRRLPAPDPAAGSDLSVNELLVSYLAHADQYYRKNGKPTSEPTNIRYAIRPLRERYGHTPAADFGPLGLKAVRQRMIESGLCRSETNKQIGKIKRAFKWAVSEGLVPPTVLLGLQAVSALLEGRCDVRESEPVGPVPDAFVEAVLPHVSRQVAAMIRLQLLTGMRPGEVCLMRTIDLDTSGKVWTYVPSTHKTAHRGKARTIMIGPKAQAVLREWLRPELEAFLFSPREAMAERQRERRAARKTPLCPAKEAKRRKAKPKQNPADRYETRSYYQSIYFACKQAGVPRWGLNRLRHSAATAIRRELGIDVARAVLGHADASTTTIYAERDLNVAAAAMAKIG
jgi:integrase